MLEVVDESGPFQLLRDHHGYLFLYEKGLLVPCASSRDALEQFECLAESVKNGDLDRELDTFAEVTVWPN